MSFPRHDTWAGGLASYLAFHDGWLKVEPGHTGVELNVWFPWSHGRTFEQAMNQPVLAFVGMHNISAHAMLMAIKDRMDDGALTECVVNLDAHNDWGGKYHDHEDNHPTIPRNYFAPFIDPAMYESFVTALVTKYPWITHIQVLNEPYYTNGTRPTQEQYTNLVVAACNGVVGTNTKVIADVTSTHTGFRFDQWATDPRCAKVIVGTHLLILHNISTAQGYYDSFMQECVFFQQEWPGRERWIDELLFVGRLPGGTTTDKGAEFVRSGMRAVNNAVRAGLIHGAAMGFAGGLEPPCNKQFKVCAALIDQHGELTKGGEAFVDEAKRLGWWREETRREEVDKIREDLEDILKDIDRADGFLESALDGIPGGKTRRKVRKALRRVEDAHDDLQDLLAE